MENLASKLTVVWVKRNLLKVIIVTGCRFWLNYAIDTENSSILKWNRPSEHIKCFLWIPSFSHDDTFSQFMPVTQWALKFQSSYPKMPLLYFCCLCPVKQLFIWQYHKVAITVFSDRYLYYCVMKLELRYTQPLSLAKNSQVVLSFLIRVRGWSCNDVYRIFKRCL
jgi:hypothetical protein